MTSKYPAEIFIGFCLLIIFATSFTINMGPTSHLEDLELVDPIFVQDSNFNSKRFLESIHISAQKASSQAIKGTSNSESTSKPASSSNSVVPDTSTNAKVANTQFNGLILYHYIPAILSNQEYFEIRGRILSPADNEPDSFVGFALFSTIDSGRYDFVKKLQFGATQFSILLNLKAIPPGEYEIGANVAWEWSNSPTKRTITKNTSVLSLEGAPQPPQNFKIDLKDNKLVFTWNEDNKTSIEKISFSQGGANREYILSNFVSKFEVPYKDFYGFKQGEVKVDLSSARSRTSSLASRNSQYSSPVSLTFVATRHRSSKKIDPDQISFDQEIPWQVEVGQSISLKGTASNDLKNKIVVEQPAKKFSNYYLSENQEALTVGSGVYFNIQIPVNSQGTYTIQILNQNGQPVLNRPVYVGNIYPLLPKYIDLQPKEIDPKAVSNAQPNTLQRQRAKLFQLINEKRIEYGAVALTEEPKLDQLAQNHSQDMVVNEYFSHINAEGETPQDRATRTGINQKVDEITAMNLNLTEAHLQIINSPSNLQIMVNPQWTNVGLGVARTSDKAFKITQIYGGQNAFTPEITDQVLSALKSKIVLQVISQYSYITKENVRLSAALIEWLNMSIQQQEAIQFGRFLETKGFNDFIRKDQIFAYGANFFQTQLKGQFLNPGNPVVTEFGVTIRKVSESEVEIYVVFV